MKYIAECLKKHIEINKELWCKTHEEWLEKGCLDGISVSDDDSTIYLYTHDCEAYRTIEEKQKTIDDLEEQLKVASKRTGLSQFTLINYIKDRVR